MFQEATYGMHSVHALAIFRVVSGKFATDSAKQNYSKKAEKQILQITHDEKSIIES